MICNLTTGILLSQKIVTKDFNSPNCCFVIGKHHLFARSADERFSKYLADLTKERLSQMNCAETEAKFEEAFNSATF